MPTIADFSATSLDGEDRALSEFQGQVVLVVNVASKCGFTGQYEGLEALYRAYSGQGFTVLGFPCDQFGHQEPGDADEIRQFCQTRYQVSFPMFAKIEVNGRNAHPLWKWLKSERPGALGLQLVKWNFTKFLLDREGRAVARYSPRTAPEALHGDIAARL